MLVDGSHLDALASAAVMQAATADATALILNCGQTVKSLVEASPRKSNIADNSKTQASVLTFRFFSNFLILTFLEKFYQVEFFFICWTIYARVLTVNNKKSKQLIKQLEEAQGLLYPCSVL